MRIEDRDYHWFCGICLIAFLLFLLLMASCSHERYLKNNIDKWNKLLETIVVEEKTTLNNKCLTKVENLELEIDEFNYYYNCYVLGLETNFGEKELNTWVEELIQELETFLKDCATKREI